ncbi:hypothetical protein Poli38472_012117 [Pythium oligandrum]|uniref:Uncharacterized protein n=1 Tax=Pythium oligandrum TaxID=41045 RepID=A0A8K1CQU6_PYTOL|nr:hypothetical protein Poli38472_012117 [Pythium oligandrum]|eukprot:TMW67001.1 hypothetical protein Poli38472_012117 [Pythium oligandrum]
MELSTAEGALRTLKFRPKVSTNAVETSSALLAVVQALKTPAEAAQDVASLHDQLAQGLTTLLLFGKERWEPLAVFNVVVRDLLHSHFDGEGKQLPFTTEFLTVTTFGAVRDYLEHWEPRVRMSVAKLIGALARWDLVWTTQKCTPLIVDSVLCNLTRSPDFEETGFDEADDNISVNGMESPTGSTQGTPRTPSTPYRLDDVSGWKALESSLSALKYVIRGSGAKFLTEKTVDGAFVYFTPEIKELATTKSVFHINRHVRVVGLDTVTALCEVAPVGFLDSHREIADLFCKCIVRGMHDNWSQVRYAACITTRAFLTKLQENAREDYYGQLVPRICLNRYYVAERVQHHSQETWRMLMGDRGRAVVARYAKEITDYYIEMTDHCVREAACHSIAELATKVDKEAIRPYVPGLLDALLYSFRDNSWLVRDAACLASSQFVLAFPTESRDVLEQLYELWIEHLSDEIWSVREDAAIALGNVIRAYGKEAEERVAKVAEDFIQRAKTQPAMSHHDHEEHMRSEKKHMSKQAFSCCSFEPKTDERHEHREVQPWEHTDGAIYLVRELCAVAPEVGVRLLPLVADVAILRHFPQTATLQETVWKQLPLMCEALGKRVFKQYLELFLDPMVFTLQGSNRLARFAARDCVAHLSKLIGPNIFLGRLKANPTWVEAIAPVVPQQPVY